MEMRDKETSKVRMIRKCVMKGVEETGWCMLCVGTVYRRGGAPRPPQPGVNLLVFLLLTLLTDTPDSLPYHSPQPPPHLPQPPPPLPTASLPCPNTTAAPPTTSSHLPHTVTSVPRARLRSPLAPRSCLPGGGAPGLAGSLPQWPR